jgi:rhodanese-related sulfurtransferase
MIVVMSQVLAVAPAPAAAAAAHFAARLSFETDVSDVHADLQADGGVEVGGRLVVVDSRSEPAWRQGHVPGALHLPTAEVAARAVGLIPPGRPVVTYCWGPGCNGATRAALAFAQLGYPVKEMIGGFEYWVRQGFAVDSPAGRLRRPVDPLTAPGRRTSDLACGC